MKKYLTLLLVFPSVASAFCFDEAGQRYNVDPDLLKAIAMQESSLNPNATNINRNQYGEIVSRDYGLMQINSEWFPRLAKFEVNELTVMEPCFNVNLGAWVLSSNFSTHGYNWNSVGAYNAGFKESSQAARDRYIIEIKNNYQEIKASNNQSNQDRNRVFIRRSLID